MTTTAIAAAAREAQPVGRPPLWRRRVSWRCSFGCLAMRRSFRPSLLLPPLDGGTRCSGSACILSRHLVRRHGVSVFFVLRRVVEFQPALAGSDSGCRITFRLAWHKCERQNEYAGARSKWCVTWRRSYLLHRRLFDGVHFLSPRFLCTVQYGK